MTARAAPGRFAATAGAPGVATPGAPRSSAALALFAVLGLAAFAAFVALGVWQIERRAWKLALIDRVEARLSATPTAAPGPAEWRSVSAETDEYRRVRLSGAFEGGRETFVQAATDLGAGYWTLAPFRTSEGFTVLVNRGFVSPDRRDAARAAPTGPAEVIGLMRLSEPKGAFLRDNDPANDLWRSRDVAAIAAKRGLADVAPYFVDADATPNPGGWPVGGLTVVAFHNAHLVYALTWFALAAMVAGGAFIVARHTLNARRGGEGGRPIG